MAVLELNGGEYVALNVVEIVSIPKLENVRDEFAAGADIEVEYRNGFGNMASEIFQNYRNILRSNPNAEVSVEFLWFTEPVQNQRYKARIRLFLVCRSLSGDESSAVNICDRICQTCQSSMELLKYNVESRSCEEVISILKSVDYSTIFTISKDESIETLDNQILPECCSFGFFDGFARDMSGIVNCLIEHPGSAILFQMIPTSLSAEEEAFLTRHADVLGMLQKGIMTQGVGNVSFSKAESLFNLYRYYRDSRNSPLFCYNILVAGQTLAAEDISSRLQAYINYKNTNATPLKALEVSVKELQPVDNYYALPWIAREWGMQNGRNQRLLEAWPAFYRLPQICTADEVSGLFRLPLGSQRSLAGLPINESDNNPKTYGNDLINSGDLEIGRIRSSANDSIGIQLQDLAKHMLVAGTPGSGKTTFLVGLLDRMWKQHHIPFLVIEPAKNEYRAMVQSIPELQVFTPGKNYISPFIFNPFVPPKNVRLETYKSTLKTAFAAAVSMSSPLDKIFEETVSNCYSDFHWLDSYTLNDKGEIFNISDFIKCFQETFDDIGYTGDARNIGRAGMVRLKSLEKLFDNYFSIPLEDLLSYPTVIELSAIENSDQKALIISLLLLSILAYVNANYVGEGGLKNVLLLEEAHVLLDGESNAAGQDSNPSGIAQNLLKRMLAEIRAYGVGVIVADQSPRKVSSDVVALTDMKVVFRLVEAMDKQIIADSMNMDEGQVRRLARFKPGEAFLFFNRLDEPEEIITPNYRMEHKISISLSDEGIKELSAYWNDKQQALRPYPQCGVVSYCNETCDYSRRMLAKEIARRLFVRYFNRDTHDFTPVKSVLQRISHLVKEELNGEPFSPELLTCVKVHLWRRIKYETKIPVKDVLIENSLKK